MGGKTYPCVKYTCQSSVHHEARSNPRDEMMAPPQRVTLYPNLFMMGPVKMVKPNWKPLARDPTKEMSEGDFPLAP